jgi:hypothetical protein
MSFYMDEYLGSKLTCRLSLDIHVIGTDTNSTQMQQSSNEQYKWWIRRTCQSKVTGAYNRMARQGTTAPATSGIGLAFVADSIKLHQVWMSLSSIPSGST